MTARLSDHLKDIRNGFKSHVHEGVMLSPYEIVGLLALFDDFIDMARDQENEISRHRWNEAARAENPAAQTGNVVLFPNARRRTPQPPHGGGDAA